MKIEEALPLLREGKKIARRMWNPDDEYTISLEPKYIVLRGVIMRRERYERRYSEYAFSHRDLFAGDWEEVQ